MLPQPRSHIHKLGPYLLWELASFFHMSTDRMWVTLEQPGFELYGSIDTWIIYLFIYSSSPRDMFPLLLEREGKKGEGREKHWLVASPTHPAWRWNSQLRYVPHPGINLQPFGYWMTLQLSHNSQGYTHFFLIMQVFLKIIFFFLAYFSIRIQYIIYIT